MWTKIKKPQSVNFSGEKIVSLPDASYNTQKQKQQKWLLEAVVEHFVRMN